jgi:hypothetical protein
VLLAVQTGKYLPGDEDSRGVQPTAAVEDFPAAVDWILENSGDATRQRLQGCCEASVTLSAGDRLTGVMSFGSAKTLY